MVELRFGFVCMFSLFLLVKYVMKNCTEEKTADLLSWCSWWMMMMIVIHKVQMCPYCSISLHLQSKKNSRKAEYNTFRGCKKTNNKQTNKNHKRKCLVCDLKSQRTDSVFTFFLQAFLELLSLRGKGRLFQNAALKVLWFQRVLYCCCCFLVTTGDVSMNLIEDWRGYAENDDCVSSGKFERQCHSCTCVRETSFCGQCFFILVAREAQEKDGWCDLTSCCSKNSSKSVWNCCGFCCWLLGKLFEIKVFFYMNFF